MEQFHEENINEQAPDEVPEEFLEHKNQERTLSGLNAGQREDLRNAIRLFKEQEGLE